MEFLNQILIKSLLNPAIYTKIVNLDQVLLYPGNTRPVGHQRTVDTTHHINRIKKPHDHLCRHRKAFNKTACTIHKEKIAFNQLAGDEDLANW